MGGTTVRREAAKVDAPADPSWVGLGLLADPVGVLDLDGALLWANRALLERWDIPPGGDLREVIHPDDLPALRRTWLTWCETGGAPRQDVRVRGEGGWVDMEVSITPDPDGRAIVAGHDVTSRVRRERLLTHLASHDGLTGLPNRSLLLDRLQQALARSDRTGTSVGALYVDLDDFKAVNDTWGHVAGDRLLVEIAHRLRRVVRPADTVARVGGDELIVAAVDLHREQEALDLADRIVEAVREPYRLGPAGGRVGCSVGVATQRGGTPQELLAAADEAVLSAKRHGKGRAVLHRG